VRELCRVLAGLLAVLLFAYPAALGGIGPPRLFVALTIVAVLSGLALWNDGAVTAAAGALGLNYLGSLHLRDVEIDVGAPLVAVALVLFVELCDLAISVPPGTPLEARFVRARAAALAAAVVLTLAASAVVVAGAVPSLGLGGAVRLVAMALAAAAVVAPVALLRRARS
jgi:hypothetical protein